MKKHIPALSLLFGLSLFFNVTEAQKFSKSNLPSKVKTSLNAYSFNDPLRSGSMNLDDLLVYCAKTGFDAVDITAYYFPGYPDVPSDEYLYSIKQKAFLMGLEISGTGVRNDFTHPDPEKRRQSIELVKKWIIAAEKLGAPVIRVFAGKSDTEGYTREQVVEWLVKDMKECVEFGKKHGVIVAVQNHHDFIVTADHAIEIIERVNSDWFGLILDTGSFWTGDSYEQIEKCIPYAVNWQIKTHTYINGEEEEIDLLRLFNLIKEGGYRGYVPIETLGEGDRKLMVDNFYNEVNTAIGVVYENY